MGSSRLPVGATGDALDPGPAVHRGGHCGIPALDRDWFFLGVLHRLYHSSNHVQYVGRGGLETGGQTYT